MAGGIQQVTELFGPVENLSQRCGLDAVEPAASGRSRAYQPRAAQDAQVLGDGRLGHAEGSSHLEDGALVVGEQDKNGAARWVGECMKDGMGMEGTRHGGGETNKCSLICQEETTLAQFVAIPASCGEP